MSANNEESRYTPSWLANVLGDPRNSMRGAPEVVHADPQVVGAVRLDQRGVVMQDDSGNRWLLGFKDEEIAAIVSDLRRISLEYGGSLQLREHLRTYLGPILRGERRP